MHESLVSAGIEWLPWVDGMAFGPDPGYFLTLQGLIFGSDSWELNLSEPANPLRRYLTAIGLKKHEHAIIPVCRAYEALLEFLADRLMSAMEWEELQVTLPGAKGFRALSVGIDDNMVTG